MKKLTVSNMDLSSVMQSETSIYPYIKSLPKTFRKLCNATHTAFTGSLFIHLKPEVESTLTRISSSFSFEESLENSLLTLSYNILMPQNTQITLGAKILASNTKIQVTKAGMTNTRANLFGLCFWALEIPDATH